MTVYVDTLRDYGWRLGPSCHLVADTDAELHAMAATIGLRRSWVQHPGDPVQYRRHYDLTGPRRVAAVAAGAREITTRELGRMILAARRAL